MALQIISREALHKHRAAQHKAQGHLHQMQTVGGEKVAVTRTDKRTRNSQGPGTARMKIMGIQRKYLVQAGS